MTPKKRIVIVGGGTSGWLTAAYLNKVLQVDREAEVEITVIASDEIGIIGVGEATVPTLRGTMQALGVPEWKLLAETDATFKNGILFKNWRYNPADAPDDGYYHLFDQSPAFEGVGAQSHWLTLVERGHAPPPFAYTSLQATLCDLNRSPKMLHTGDYEGGATYAYHLDAVMLGIFLKSLATERGVHFIEDRITEAKLADDGSIHAVRTVNHGDVEGDLFIDCSGFHSLLIEKALKEPWLPYGDMLFCDRAVALPVPYISDPEPRAFTTSTALSSGWAWEIDLATRRGTGYVYSSKFISPEDAEAELRRHVGAASDGVEARHLTMRVGRRRNPWVKNCLAIGLSAGFIEPLESTGIYLVEVGIQLFLDHFSLQTPRPATQAVYNRSMSELYEQIRDFVILHYCLTERDDTPFWRAVSDEGYLPATLKAQLDLWAEKLPSITDLVKNPMLFLNSTNYFSILAGLGYLPDPGSRDGLTDEASALRFRMFMDGVHQRVAEMAPPHSLVLDKLRGAAV